VAQIRERDNGIGIPAAALPTVFDMVSHLEPALDRAKGGLGIGLALVRGIVGLHGGTVDAASDGPGHGSEFTVRLPLAVGAACTPADPAGEAVSAAVTAVTTDPVRVLVVDDNRDAAETLAMALEVFGSDTRIAHTAADALALVPGFQPHVALLDIGLPDMNGYELARRLRQTPGGSAMKLIAITGWGQQKDRERALEAGFDHHMTKPIELGILRGLVGESPDR
jgi:CheY-like chemotaxis protein